MTRIHLDHIHPRFADELNSSQSVVHLAANQLERNEKVTQNSRRQGRLLRWPFQNCLGVVSRFAHNYLPRALPRLPRDSLLTLVCTQLSHANTCSQGQKLRIGARVWQTVDPMYRSPVSTIRWCRSTNPQREQLKPAERKNSRSITHTTLKRIINALYEHLPLLSLYT